MRQLFAFGAGLAGRTDAHGSRLVGWLRFDEYRHTPRQLVSQRAWVTKEGYNFLHLILAFVCG